MALTPKNKTEYTYLYKHNRYIDYRVSELANYIHASTSIDASSVIKDCIFFLIDKQTYIEYFPEQMLQHLRDIKELLSRWSIAEHGDILGYIYQQLENRTCKKKKGQYFTPTEIVNYIVRNIIDDTLDIEQIKIFDPACGSGQFLIAAFKRLVELYQAQGYTFMDASRQILTNNLYGIDLDPIAVEITKFNLKHLGNMSQQLQLDSIYNDNFLINETLSPRTTTWSTKTYDIIIGNPPWGSSLSNQEKSYFKKHYYAAKSGVNTFTLFIEKSMEYISAGGRIGFLIPEAYLNIKAHKNSRADVLSRMSIKEISLWGEQFKNVFAPSISITLQHTTSDQERNENVVQIRKEHDLAENTATLIPQNYYHKTYENIFNINYSRKAVNIISAIDDQDCMFLKNNARFFLGIVTGNNPKYIQKDRSENTPDKIIIGKDISPFKISFSDNYFKYDPQQLQQVAPKHLYQTKNKILYKFIGKKLSFALDNEGHYTLNNVNGFIPDTSAIAAEPLLAVLNSRVIQYYYEKNFFTLKVLRGNLEKLPLKNLSKSSQQKLSWLTSRAIHTETESELKQCRDTIDDIILYEYGLKDKQGYAIWEQTRTNRYQQILPGF